MVAGLALWSRLAFARLLKFCPGEHTWEKIDLLLRLCREALKPIWNAAKGS